MLAYQIKMQAIDKREIELIFKKYEVHDFKWMNPADIVISQWVRVKCTFGCADYGRAVCPPNTPRVHECRDFFKEYHNAVIFRVSFIADKDNYPADYSKKLTNALLKIEREVFLKGYYKAFMFNQTCCDLCADCRKTRKECINKKESRPSPEAFAIDVYETVRNAGFEIYVIKNKNQEINRYAFLMLD